MVTMLDAVRVRVIDELSFMTGKDIIEDKKNKIIN